MVNDAAKVAGLLFTFGGFAYNVWCTCTSETYAEQRLHCVNAIMTIGVVTIMVCMNDEHIDLHHQPFSCSTMDSLGIDAINA